MECDFKLKESENLLEVNINNFLKLSFMLLFNGNALIFNEKEITFISCIGKFNSRHFRFLEGLCHTSSMELCI